MLKHNINFRVKTKIKTKLCFSNINNCARKQGDTEYSKLIGSSCKLLLNKKLSIKESLYTKKFKGSQLFHIISHKILPPTI